MKNCKFAILYLLLCLNFSCKNKFAPANAVVHRSTQNDSIILVNKVAKNEQANLYDASMYETAVFPIVFKNVAPASHVIHATTPLFLFSNGLATVFIVYPGEHIEVRANSRKEAVMSIANNPVRTNELSFFQDLMQKYPEPMAKVLKITTANGFKNMEAVYAVWYSNAIAFLKAYSQSKKISPQFIEVASKYLYYKHLSDVLQHIYTSPNAANLISGTAYAKFPVCDSCLHMSHYRYALYCYNKILSAKKQPSNSFTAEFDTAKAITTGSTRTWLLYFILNSYINDVNKPEFTQRINSFFATYPRDTSVKLLKYIYNIKSASLNNHSLYDEKLLAVNNQLIKWKDVLLKNKGKVIVIDFWAKYCGPCVYEIPFSQRLEKELGNKDLVFVYVSFDASKSTWMDSMNELHFKNRQNSFFLFAALGSNIGKYYQVKYIPKYVVYNKKGDMVTNDAPRPSDPAMKKMLKELLVE